MKLVIAVLVLLASSLAFTAETQKVPAETKPENKEPVLIFSPGHQNPGNHEFGIGLYEPEALCSASTEGNQIMLRGMFPSDDFTRDVLQLTYVVQFLPPVKDTYAGGSMTKLVNQVALHEEDDFSRTVVGAELLQLQRKFGDICTSSFKKYLPPWLKSLFIQ